MSCNLKENVIEVFNPTNGQHLKEIPITTDSQFKEIIEKSI